MSSRRPTSYHLLTSIDPSEGKDEPEVQSPVDACAPTSTPVPAELRRDALPRKKTQISVPTPANPRQAILPRKKASTPVSVPAEPRRSGQPCKSASTSAPNSTLFGPLIEEADTITELSSPVVDEPPMSADHVVHDAPLIAGDLHEIDEVAEVIEATNEDHSTAAANTEQPPTSVEPLHESVEEPGKQEVELVDSASGHAEEATDDPQVFPEQPRGVVEAGEDKEARRHRVVAEFVQIGAFNPLAGPPLVSQPRRPFISELTPILSEEPLDIEDEANVDTERDEENPLPPPGSPARHATVPSIEHDTAEAHLETDPAGGKLGDSEHAQVHRDGES